MTQANVGLTQDQVEGVVGLLKAALADEYVLYTKTRNFHWNVTGPQFNDLHKFFETQYGEIETIIDEVAESIRYFGVKSPGSLKEFLETTRLKEATDGNLTARQMVQALVEDHEALVRCLRSGIDAATEQYHSAEIADFFTTLMEQHLKMAWMLRSMVD